MILRIALLSLFMTPVVAVGGLSEAQKEMHFERGVEEISPPSKGHDKSTETSDNFLFLTTVVDKESAWTGKVLRPVAKSHFPTSVIHLAGEVPEPAETGSDTDVFVEWTKDARNRDITDRDFKSYVPLERLVAAFDPGSPEDEKCLDEENKLCVGFTFFDIEDSWLGKIVDVDKTRQSASVQWVETSDGKNTIGSLDQIFFERMAVAEHGYCIDIESLEYCVGQFLLYGKSHDPLMGGVEKIIGEVMGVHEEGEKVIIHRIESGDEDFFMRRTSISPKNWEILDSQCAGSENREQYCVGEKVIDMRDLWEGEIVAIINGQEDEEKEVVVKWKKIRESGLSLSVEGEADNKDIVPVKYLMIPREGK